MNSFKVILFASAASISATAVSAMDEVVFGTNWLAQAEHGGFYQSVADGTYAECGLDVSIVSGGPQVNNRALMIAGKIDYHMGGDMLQAFNAVKEGIPVVSVAAIFQKHPQVILAHPGKANSFEDLKNLTLLIGDNGFASYYQWMICRIRVYQGTTPTLYFQSGPLPRRRESRHARLIFRLSRFWCRRKADSPRKFS